MELKRDGVLFGGRAAVTGGAGVRYNANAQLQCVGHVWNPDRAGGEPPETIGFVCVRWAMCRVRVLFGTSGGNRGPLEVGKRRWEWRDGDEATDCARA